MIETLYWVETIAILVFIQKSSRSFKNEITNNVFPYKSCISI